MGKKIRSTVLLISIYLIVFYIGFKSGAVYSRIHNKIQFEKVTVPYDSGYYIVENRDCGTYSTVTFEKADNTNVIIDMMMNEKLRPLLKLRNIKIYKSTGEQVY